MRIVACQRDARLRAIDTVAIACDPVDGGWEIALDDTVLYPEGGGQPADHGTIGGVRVRDVRHRGDAVVHLADGPVPLGPVRVAVDWARRFDHMQQHTGQHLLTAVAQDRSGWATTSFHLHARGDGAVPRCDIEVDAEVVSDAALADLEDAVNAEIRADHAVIVHEVDRAAYAAMRVRSRGVPDGVDAIRLVEIAGIDVNTCGGTHVARTGELQALKLLGVERIRGGSRLHFAVGGRVLDRLGEALGREAALNRILSEGPEGHVAAVDRLSERARSGDKVARALQTELAGLLGDALAADPRPVVALHRDDADPAFLNAIASRAVRDGDGRVLVLSGGAPGDGAFVIAGPPDRVGARKDAVLALIDGRGGGRPGRLQGRAARLDRIGEVVALFGEAP